MINENDFKALTEKPRRLVGKVKPLKSYNNKPIKTKGRCRLKVAAKGKHHNLLFTIVPNGHESLLGDKAPEDFGLVKSPKSSNMKMANQDKRLAHQDCEGSADVVNKFSSVFKGHGTLTYTYKIQLKDDAKPVVHAPRSASTTPSWLEKRA